MSSKAAKRERRRQWSVTKTALLRIMGGLRRLLGRDFKQVRAKFPDHPLPCKTCAFRSATDSWKGMDRTCLNLLSGLINEKPFYCHVNPATGEPFPIFHGEYGVQEAMLAGKEVSLCAAWSVIQGYPPEEYLGIMADALAGHPVPRPLPTDLRETLTKFANVLNKQETLREVRPGDSREIARKCVRMNHSGRLSRTLDL